MPVIPSKIAPRVIGDTLLALLEAVKAIDTSGAETLAAFDRIFAAATERRTSFFAAAEELGETLTPEVVSLVLMMLMYGFYKEGAGQLAALRDHVTLLEPGAGSAAGRLLERAVDVAAELAAMHLRSDQGQDPNTDDAVEPLDRLVDELQTAGHLAPAARCADARCNFTPHGDDPRFLAASHRALALALRDGDADFVGVCTARVAVATAAAAEAGACSKLQVLDAVERALMWLPTDPGRRERALSLVRTCLRGPAAVGPGREPLVAIFGMLTSAERPELPGRWGKVDPTLLLRPITDSDPAAWVSSVSGAAPLIAAIENARLALEPGHDGSGPFAAWETWSIVHPALRRAVPNGSSVLRERDLDELLLTLKHEITHVLSMAGNVGLAMLVLRGVVLDREIALWTFGDDGELRPPPQDDVLRFGVAPLHRRASIGALAEAEQALEATRRLQIIEDVWGPWLEGLAVYTELADDPTDDPDAENFASSVLRNIVDENPVRQGPDGPVYDEARAREHMRASEQRYAGALKGQARDRLRRYLAPDQHGHYLAGYLAVRKVVATWRRTLGRPLSGSAASQLLLHVTRFGAEETLPDLALPLEAFRADAVRRLRAWIAQVSRISAEDIERLHRGAIEPTHAYFWENGRLLAFQRDDPALPERMERAQKRLFMSASAILSGKHADPARVPGATEATRALLEETAASLARNARVSEKLVDGFVEASLRTMNALPLGSVEAPFWLNTKLPGVLMMIRTTETRRETNAPSHDGLAMSLSREQFAVLEEEVRLRQAHRMKVTRIADLLPTPEAGRAMGVHYLVFECGKFLEIQPRGIAFGSNRVAPSLAEDIRLRCHPGRLLGLEARVLANGLAGARRTRDWLASAPSWVEWETTADVAPWIAHVARLADDVLAPEPRPERRAAAQALLGLVLDDAERARATAEEGLDALFADPQAKSGALTLLDQSGRSPAPLPPGLGEAAAASLFERTRHGWDVAAMSKWVEDVR